MSAANPVPGAASAASRPASAGPFDPALLRTVPETRWPVVALGGLGVVQGVVAIAQALAVADLVVAVVRDQPLAQVLLRVVVLFALRGLLAGAVERVGAWAGVVVSTSLRRHAIAAVLGRAVAPAGDRARPGLAGIGPGDTGPGGSGPAGAGPGGAGQAGGVAAGGGAIGSRRQGDAADSARMQVLLDQGPTAVEPYVARYLPALVGAVVLPLGAIAVMAALDWRIALIPVLTVPLLPLFAALIGATTAAETARRWSAMEGLAGHFRDVVQGITTLVGYGRAERQVATIREASQRLRTTTVATLRLAFLSAAALELLASISVAIVAVFVGLALAEGRMDLAVGLPLILVAPEAWWPIRRVGVEFHAAADGAAAVTRLLAVVRDDRVVTPDPDGPVEAHQSWVPGIGGEVAGMEGWSAPRIVMAHLVVGHERPLVGPIDLVVPVGLTAVVGPSGVGKTTLLEALAGVAQPMAGSVVAPQAHLVGQRPFLLAEDLATNLALGAAGGSTTAAMGAVVAAVGLDRFVATLPAGLATRIGDDGMGLSAGQRTRLALARGLLSSAPVLLVDEPTAHLDDQAVEDVVAAIAAAARHRVVVVATHDARLVAASDHVLDLGTHRAPGAHAAVVDTHLDQSAVVAVDGEASRDGEAGRSGSGTRTVDPAAPVRDGPDAAVDRDGLAGVPLSRVASGRHVVASGVVGGLARACGVALTATSGWLIVAASLEPQILLLLVAIVMVRAFGIARPVLRWWERVRSHDAALADLAQRRTRLWTVLVPLAPARLAHRRRSRFLSGLVDDLDDVVSASVRVVVPVVAVAVAAGVAVAVAWWASAGAVLPLLVLVGGVALVAVTDLAIERRAQPDVVAGRGRVTDVVDLVARHAHDVRGIGPPAVAWTTARLEVVQGSLRTAVGRQAWGRAVGVGGVPLLVGGATAWVAVVAQQAVAAGLPTPVAALLVLVPLGLSESMGGDVAAAAGEWARAVAAGHRLDDLVARAPAVHDPAVPVPLPAGLPTIDLLDATASWDPARDPVDLPDLSLATGARVGLVGPNGSGKSTTMAVLARHLDPVTGRLAVGGVDVTAATLAAVRRLVAIVDDEPHVFASTLRENLRLARPGATDEALCAALDTAGLRGWLDTLPDGLDTHLGTGGRGVSGGERSRLAMARAVVAARPVVLLDEPVAHLDHPTAVAVMRDVIGAFDGTTVVVAMHRPEGMDALDEIIQLAGQAPASAGAHRPLASG